MELLQAIWISLITPNDGLTSVLFNKFGIPFIFIELTVNMLLFTTALNIPSTKKQKTLYVLLYAFLVGISNTIISKPYSTYLNMITCAISIFFIFNPGVLKTIIAVMLPMIISAPLEIMLSRFYLVAFNLSYEMAFSIPLIRLLSTLLIYLIIFLIYVLIKKFKDHNIFFDTLSIHNKLVILFNSIVGIITICTQFYLIGYYYDTLPSKIVALSLLTLSTYFFISIFSLLKTTKLEVTNQNLEKEKDYNTTLKLLYDDIRTFRHDFGNIVQAIGGYIDTNNMDGLKEYYKQLQVDIEDVKSLEMLNPINIDNPAVYSILTAKYHKAANLGITMTIHVSLKLETLNMKIYEFTRILGILLDNAIEACQDYDDKIINLEIRKDEKSPRQLLLIQNTYSDKNINVNRIREKGYTSKKDDGKQHGLGLWEVDKILKRAKNLNLYTTKDSIFFTQQLEMYNHTN